MIGRRPRPVPSHSLLYKLPPVQRLTRYQRCWCILSQREYILNHIKGDLGPLKYPSQIVISDRPHLVYEASLQDLLEPMKEVVIAFIYRAKNGNNIFYSRTLPYGAFEWTHSRPFRMDGILEGGVPPKSCTSVTVTVNKIVVVLGEECRKWQQRISLLYAPSRHVRMNSLKASSNEWNFGGGSAPKVLHLCDCNHQQDSRGTGRGVYGRNRNWINNNNNFKESRKYNNHNKDDCHHQRYHASRNWDNGWKRGWEQHC